ncbi:MAG: hypothetical protein HY898_05645 [Deltaproteobacteria bacterium]|nr:hypothetical protein [Deltaproteobacteria bacterium]
MNRLPASAAVCFGLLALGPVAMAQTPPPAAGSLPPLPPPPPPPDAATSAPPAGPGPGAPLVAPDPNAPPAPTQPRAPLVDVDYAPSADAPLLRHIIEQGQTRWQLVCERPCQVALDPRFVYKIAGEGWVESNQFMLPPGQNRATIRAEVGSRTSLIAGFVMGYGGGVLAMTGLMTAGLGAILEHNAEQPSYVNGTGESGDPSTGRNMKWVGVGMAGVGVVVGVVGLVIAIPNISTDVSINGAPAPGATARMRLKLSSGLALTANGLEF